MIKQALFWQTGLESMVFFLFTWYIFIVSSSFFQNVENAPTEAFKTAYKGVGLRATADFPVETFIMEYVGEVLNESKFHKRAKKYSKVSLRSFSKIHSWSFCFKKNHPRGMLIIYDTEQNFINLKIIFIF
jgi:hypothetical protein